MKFTFQKFEVFVKTNVNFQPLNIFAKSLNLPSQHLPTQSYQKKHQNKVGNMFRVNNSRLYC